VISFGRIKRSSRSDFGLFSAARTRLTPCPPSSSRAPSRHRVTVSEDNMLIATRKFLTHKPRLARPLLPAWECTPGGQSCEEVLEKIPNSRPRGSTDYLARYSRTQNIRSSSVLSLDAAENGDIYLV
jgi:hypothetical protein